MNQLFVLLQLLPLMILISLIPPFTLVINLTAENLQEVAENAINNGTEEFQFKAAGSVTDNTGNVSKHRKNIVQEKPFIVFKCLDVELMFSTCLQRTSRRKILQTKLLQFATSPAIIINQRLITWKCRLKLVGVACMIA